MNDSQATGKKYRFFFVWTKRSEKEGDAKQQKNFLVMKKATKNVQVKETERKKVDCTSLCSFSLVMRCTLQLSVCCVYDINDELFFLFLIFLHFAT